MSEQLLDGPNVVASQEEVSRERMAEGVASCVHGDAGSPNRVVEGPLETALMDVVAVPFPRARIARTTRRRKGELPTPFLGGFGVLPRQRIGKSRRPSACVCVDGLTRLATNEQGGTTTASRSVGGSQHGSPAGLLEWNASVASATSRSCQLYA